MYFLFKMEIFRCYVCLPEGNIAGWKMNFFSKHLDDLPFIAKPRCTEVGIGNGTIGIEGSQDFCPYFSWWPKILR